MYQVSTPGIRRAVVSGKSPLCGESGHLRLELHAPLQEDTYFMSRSKVRVGASASGTGRPEAEAVLARVREFFLGLGW